MRTRAKSQAGAEKNPLNDRVVLEVRAWMARRGHTQQTLGAALGVGQVWVSRRIGNSHERTLLTLDDLQKIADALEVPPETLLMGSSPDPRWFGGIPAPVAPHTITDR